MSVIALIESANGIIQGKYLTVLNYASETARLMRSKAVALVIGKCSASQLSNLSRFGADKIYFLSDGRVEIRQSVACIKALVTLIEKEQAMVIITSQDYYSKEIAAKTAACLKAGLAINAIAYPYITESFVVKCAMPFAGASAFIKLNSDLKVVVIAPRKLIIKEIIREASVMSLDISFNDQDFYLYKNIEENKVQNLSNAKIVVSGGLGLQGLGSWELLENLRSELGGIVGCTKPITDLGLRPITDCIGQDGVTISPELYIGIGVSGAAHHTVGLKDVKTVFIINKDEKAPFFSKADYGIVGDSTTILPQLIEELKKIKKTVVKTSNSIAE